MTLYLEDLSEGQIFRSEPRVLAAEEIIRFARDNDPQYFHIDAEAAKASLFGGLVASGWQTAALSMRLLIEGPAPFAGGLVGMGAELSWPKPVRPGELDPHRGRGDAGQPLAFAPRSGDRDPSPHHV